MIETNGPMACRRDGHGPTVVLLHGIPGRGQAWRRVRDRLGPGYDVVVPDLVGFGASRRPSHPTLDNIGPTAQCVALAALLDDLGVGGVTLVGHDYGAPIAVLLAVSRPDLVGGLGLLAGNTFPDTPVPFPLSLTTAPVVGPVAARLLFSSPSLALMLRRGTGPGSPPPDPGVYLGDSRQRRSIAAIFSGALTSLVEVYTPVAAALEQLEVPVMVGWGDRDPFFPLEQADRTAAAAKARLRVFDGAGHFLPHERPTEVAEEIAELARSVDR